MLLVCPDGVVVAYAWKRQLAGIPLAPLITWISALEISEEELRACLRDGSVSCTILDKLVPGSLEGSGSSNELMSVERFLVALDELGLLVFELSDLEQDPSSTKGTTSNADTSKKRAVGVLEQDNVIAEDLDLVVNIQRKFSYLQTIPGLLSFQRPQNIPFQHPCITKPNFQMMESNEISKNQVKVLRSMRPIKLEDVVLGQYKNHTRGGVAYPAYIDDKTVPKGSLTPTFAAAALFIDNARWDGVPFLMKAGKALHTKRAEIRVQFRKVPGNLYNRNFGADLDHATNELVIKVQPDEGIYLKINNKIPGLGMKLDRSNLNLHYAARYSKEIPDAYERLLLDAIEGERRLFIRSDELDAAWSLFTPVLNEIEEKKITPEYYPYGSRGPVCAHYLAARYNVRWGDLGLDVEK